MSGLIYSFSSYETKNSSYSIVWISFLSSQSIIQDKKPLKQTNVDLTFFLFFKSI